MTASQQFVRTACTGLFAFAAMGLVIFACLIAIDKEMAFRENLTLARCVDGSRTLQLRLPECQQLALRVVAQADLAEGR